MLLMLKHPQRSQLKRHVSKIKIMQILSPGFSLSSFGWDGGVYRGFWERVDGVEKLGLCEGEDDYR
jgi:hypothetical protein